MKRIFFHTPALGLKVLFIVLIFTSCKKQVGDTAVLGSPEEIATATGGGKPTGPSTIYLKVTINDDVSNKISSDGKGDYINGVDNVRAELDGLGSFQFDARNQSKPGQSVPLIRWINFNFSDPLFGSPITTLPFSGDQQIGNRMITNSSSLTPYTPIQNMTVGASQCVTLATGSTYNTRTEPLPVWRVNFHGNYEDVSTSPTSFAIITRISDSQWTIIPGTCSISTNADVGALRNGDILYGYYHMSFSFTLTKL